MTDVVEGQFTEAGPPQSALVAMHSRSLEQQSGTLALAAMSDQEFATRLAALKKGRDRMATIQRELMDKDVDYGVIPGTKKPTLLKPGAEKLCDIYGLRADFIPRRILGDGITTPAIAYEVRCELHLGSLDGPIVAVGYGSANSWERKHRYRTGERACPKCGSIGSLLRSKKGNRPEWFCWLKRGGCGETFALEDPAIVDQKVGDIENPDPHDLDTTLLKMAEKRGHVDGTLRACAASGLFTQDVEDLGRSSDGDDHTDGQTNGQADDGAAGKSLADQIADKKAEVVTGAGNAAFGCPIESPKGEACTFGQGHDGDHRKGNKSWPTPAPRAPQKQADVAAGAAPAPEPAPTGDGEARQEEGAADTPAAAPDLTNDAAAVFPDAIAREEADEIETEVSRFGAPSAAAPDPKPVQRAEPAGMVACDAKPPEANPLGLTDLCIRERTHVGAHKSDQGSWPA